MADPVLRVSRETWPIRGGFTISRGTRTEAEVVIAEITAGEVRGRGECVPYARYGETVESVIGQIEGVGQAIRSGADLGEACGSLPAGAARNAVDCAIWDLRAKRTGRPVYELASLPAPVPCTTAYTISLADPATMAAAAGAAAGRPVLKLKLGGDGDIERVRAVRAAVPGCTLIVDANEAWTPDLVGPYLTALAALDVRLVEQPLPAADDGALAGITHAVPVCADESFHTGDDVAGLAGRYDAVNVKLDKTGGLSGAIGAMAAARQAGLDIMIGCMIGTSLGMAPAVLLAGGAAYVDLDGPLLLAKDRADGLRYDDGLVYPPRRELWG